MTEVRLQVNGYADSDELEQAQFAREIRTQLRALGVEDVDHPEAPAPPGAKGTAFEWAQLAVTLSAGLPPLMGALRSWLGRRSGASLVLEVGGDRLTLTDADLEGQRDVVDAWLTAHGVR